MAGWQAFRPSRSAVMAGLPTFCLGSGRWFLALVSCVRAFRVAPFSSGRNQAQQRLQGDQAQLQVAIDQGGIEFGLGLKLHPGPFQPALDGGLRIGATAADAAFQFLEGGRLDHQLIARREGATHLPGPLQFDLEQDGSAGGQMLLHGLSWGAVEIARELGPFQEAARGHLGFEGLARQEAVVLAVHLSRPGGAGGGRNREPDLGMAFQKPAHQGAFADTARTGDHAEPGQGSGGAWGGR